MYIFSIVFHCLHFSSLFNPADQEDGLDREEKNTNKRKHARLRRQLRDAVRGRKTEIDQNAVDYHLKEVDEKGNVNDCTVVRPPLNARLTSSCAM